MRALVSPLLVLSQHVGARNHGDRVQTISPAAKLGAAFSLSASIIITVVLMWVT